MKTLLLLAALCCASPSPDFTRSVLALSGAYSIEELSESELERFESLRRRPLPLNVLSAAALVRSGLLNAYQAASICDYRSRSGDILSLAEFALIDGIGAELADALAPFVDFRPSGDETHRPRIDGSARVGVGWKPSPSYEASLKAGLTLRRFEFFGSYRRRSLKNGFTLGAGYENSRFSLCLGDYRLRLGQGLVAWSGFSMAGVSGPSSLNRNPTGLALAHSYTSYLRGAAASYSFGRTEIGASWTIPAVARDPGSGVLYVSRLSERGQWAAKAYLDRLGVVAGLDGKRQFGECCLFGEAAYSFRAVKHAPAIVGGVDWAPAYGKRFALALRYYGPDYDAPLSGALRSSTKTVDELGASCSLTLSDLGVSADLSRALSASKSVGKLAASYSPVFSLPFGLELSPSLKASLSYRPYNLYKSRADLRAELGLKRGPLQAHFRFEAVRCRELSWLWYLELGYEGEVKAFARFTLFRIDNWDDRIYVYERDAPGNFSSTAYYGRGLGASLYLKYRSAYLVFRLLRHPWSDPSKSETGLSLQYEF